MSKKIYDVDLMIVLALGSGPKTQPQLAEHTSLSRETVRQSILRLKASGRLSRENGIYSLSSVPFAA